jgi:Rad3-related DNA helicase
MILSYSVPMYITDSLLLDEAHNLIDAISEMNSAVLSLQQVHLSRKVTLDQRRNQASKCVFGKIRDKTFEH